LVISYRLSVISYRLSVIGGLVFVDKVDDVDRSDQFGQTWTRWTGWTGWTEAFFVKGFSGKRCWLRCFVVLTSWCGKW
jgi:hypothetical protein